MYYFIIAVVCLIAGFVAGALVYRKNAAKVQAVVTAVAPPPKP